MISKHSHKCKIKFTFGMQKAHQFSLIQYRSIAFGNAATLLIMLSKAAVFAAFEVKIYHKHVTAVSYERSLCL